MNTLNTQKTVTEAPETPQRRNNEPTAVEEEHIASVAQRQPAWREWGGAFLRILPMYLATHIAYLLLTYLANLFLLGNFSPQKFPANSILEMWNHWDTGQFTGIAAQGYTGAWQTAFFPLYPLLEKSLGFLMHPYPAGLLISNLATLSLFTICYRLVRMESDEAHAKRSVLYLAIFPTAFFLSAAYNEALFLFLVVACIYQLRRQHWLLAGLFGLFASLTRSAGILLLLPFYYEYLRLYNFNPLAIVSGHVTSVMKRVATLAAGLLIPAGLGLFMLYCYRRFHDALAFSHAQKVWGRSLQPPWRGYTRAFLVIQHRAFLSFDSIHNVMDITMGLLMFVLVVLCFVGPWRFKRERSVYALYAVAFYLFLTLFPATGTFPLQSLSRLVIEIFPVFIVFGAMGKREQFNLYYVTISLSLMTFMALLFLTGRWMV